MRLINVETLAIEQFLSEKVPEYAILSHTWGEDEIDFQSWNQWLASQDQAVARGRGHTKIMGMVRLTQAHGLRYAWVDTNCIDKTSSAELSEAINSMFRYYERSSVCIVLLEDVHEQDIADRGVLQAMKGCRWLTRGWTLQELLAPQSIQFFCAEGTKIGTKESLCEELEALTGIEAKYLNPSSANIFDASLSCRMSWASRRTTTRQEDMAYCLMGIFDINMPLLYGEGNKAFLRLQEELIKVTSDHTIFAWSWPFEWPSSTRGWPTFFAPSPQAFEHSGNLISTNHMYMHGLESQLYTMTNIGLSIQLRLIPMATFGKSIAVLQCRDSRVSEERSILSRHTLLGIPIFKDSVHTCRRTPYPAYPLRVPAGIPTDSARLYIDRPMGLSRLELQSRLKLRVEYPPGFYFPLLMPTTRWGGSIDKDSSPSWNKGLGCIYIGAPNQPQNPQEAVSQGIMLRLRRNDQAPGHQSSWDDKGHRINLSITPHVVSYTQPLCFHITMEPLDPKYGAKQSCRFQPYEVNCTWGDDATKQSPYLDLGLGGLHLRLAERSTRIPGDPDRFMNVLCLVEVETVASPLVHDSMPREKAENW